MGNHESHSSYRNSADEFIQYRTPSRFGDGRRPAGHEPNRSRRDQSSPAYLAGNASPPTIRRRRGLSLNGGRLSSPSSSSVGSAREMKQPSRSTPAFKKLIPSSLSGTKDYLRNKRKKLTEYLHNRSGNPFKSTKGPPSCSSHGAVKGSSAQMKRLKDLMSTWNIRDLEMFMDTYDVMALMRKVRQCADSSRPLSPKLRHDMLDLFHKGYFSDLVLSYQGSVFAVHKCILFCRCPYFRSILTADPGVEEIEVSVKTPGVTARAFGALLQYLYCGRLITRDLGNIDLSQLIREFGSLNPLEVDLAMLFEQQTFGDCDLVFTHEQLPVGSAQFDRLSASSRIDVVIPSATDSDNSSQASPLSQAMASSSAANRQLCHQSSPRAASPTTAVRQLSQPTGARIPSPSPTVLSDCISYYGGFMSAPSMSPSPCRHLYTSTVGPGTASGGCTHPLVRIRCHRAILAARSPFFRRHLLRLRDDDAATGASGVWPVLSLNEALIARKYYRCMLHCLYTDALSMEKVVKVSSSVSSLSDAQAISAGSKSCSNVDDAIELFMIGQLLELAALVQSTEQLIVDYCSKNLDLLLPVLTWSARPHGSPFVHRQVMQMLLQRFSKFSQRLHFLDLPGHVLKQLVQSDFVECTEDELLAAAYAWAQNQAVKAVERREPNLLAHGASLSRRGLRRSEQAVGSEIRRLLAPFLSDIRWGLIAENNSVVAKLNADSIVITPLHFLNGSCRPRLYPAYLSAAEVVLLAKVKAEQENKLSTEQQLSAEQQLSNGTAAKSSPKKLVKRPQLAACSSPGERLATDGSPISQPPDMVISHVSSVSSWDQPPSTGTRVDEDPHYATRSLSHPRSNKFDLDVVPATLDRRARRPGCSRLCSYPSDGSGSVRTTLSRPSPPELGRSMRFATRSCHGQSLACQSCGGGLVGTLNWRSSAGGTVAAGPGRSATSTLCSHSFDGSSQSSCSATDMHSLADVTFGSGTSCSSENDAVALLACNRSLCSFLVRREQEIWRSDVVRQVLDEPRSSAHHQCLSQLVRLAVLREFNLSDALLPTWPTLSQQQGVSSAFHDGAHWCQPPDQSRTWRSATSSSSLQQVRQETSLPTSPSGPSLQLSTDDELAQAVTVVGRLAEWDRRRSTGRTRARNRTVHVVGVTSSAAVTTAAATAASPPPSPVARLSGPSLSSPQRSAWNEPVASFRRRNSSRWSASNNRSWSKPAAVPTTATATSPAGRRLSELELLPTRVGSPAVAFDLVASSQADNEADQPASAAFCARQSRLSTLAFVDDDSNSVIEMETGLASPMSPGRAAASVSSLVDGQTTSSWLGRQASITGTIDGQSEGGPPPAVVSDTTVRFTETATRLPDAAALLSFAASRNNNGSSSSGPAAAVGTESAVGIELPSRVGATMPDIARSATTLPTDPLQPALSQPALSQPVGVPLSPSRQQRLTTSQSMGSPSSRQTTSTFSRLQRQRSQQATCQDDGAPSPNGTLYV